MIIGLVGKIGSGKSTITNLLAKKYDFTKYAFADPIKRIGEVFGFDKKTIYGSQEEKLLVDPVWNISTRVFLQRFGSDLCRNQFPKVFPEMKLNESVWIRLADRKLQENSNKNFVFSDVRFPDEADFVKRKGGVLIKVTRTVNDVSPLFSTSNHVSETSVQKINTNFQIENNSTINHLEKSIEKIILFLSK